MAKSKTRKSRTRISEKPSPEVKTAVKGTQKPNISRRTVLAIIGSTVAAAAAAVAVNNNNTNQSGYNFDNANVQDIHSNLEQQSAEEVAVLNYELPEVTYVNGGWRSLPELPSSMSMSEFESVSAAFTENLVEIFRAEQEDADAREQAKRTILNKCMELLVSINPDFGDILDRHLEEYRNNPYRLVYYINQFLVHNGYYLFCEFNENQDVNLYSLQEFGEIEINSRPTTEYVVLGDGLWPDLNESSGLIIPEYPEVVHIFPGIIEQHVDSYTDTYGGSRESFISNFIRGTKYHEAIHLYLFDQFHIVGDPSRTIPGRITISIAGVEKNLSGDYSAAQAHELCAIGAQLAIETDPRIALTFIGNPNPAYRLAVQLLSLIGIEEMDPSSPDRAAMLQSVINAERRSSIPVEGLKNYYGREETTEAINRVGMRMYGIGIELLSRFEANSR